MYSSFVWTITQQAPLSMGFPRQQYWSRLPFPSPGNLPNQRLNLHLLHWQEDFFCLFSFLALSHQGSSNIQVTYAIFTFNVVQISPYPKLLYRLAAAAAAKSLQLCPTLCDPMDCSLPGSPVRGICQARVLEWVAIAFSVYRLNTILINIYQVFYR